MNRYLPAEWHPQFAIQLTWPHEHTDWDWVLADIQQFYIQLINTILEYEHVILSVPASEDADAIQSKIKSSTFQCFVYTVENNDTWARDHGPISIFKDGKLALVDYIFNGWGRKFDARLDNQITQQLFTKNAYPTSNMESQNFILEGGSIESDGNGCILTTEKCLLNVNRNASLTRTQIENHFKDILGCSKLLWLKHGDLEGDDTDAHIDTLARFAPNNQIIFQGCQDKDDIHYQELKAMKAELSELTNKDNQPFKLVELPWPSAQFEMGTTQRLPATYANFLFINTAVLCPIYGVPEDKKAIEVMTKALPQYTIIPIDCSIVIRQYGSLHCLTMQIPTRKIMMNESYE